ncbi:hypothetical protein M9Y10_035656 [Tritrichomonas musculus]|uniref:Uncharacterized protein n=1 Tax=Tritrichomonas musculus TaxID=1915356 RepID=A0ABR2GX78_9EUKA
MSKEQAPARKSLFSLSVDDIIIQRIFKSLEEELKKLTLEVQEIKIDLPNYALKKDFDSLSESFSNFTLNTDKSFLALNEKLDTSIQDTKKQYERMQRFVEGQISDAVFSVNNVARAQNALIEEKIFQLSKPSLEYEQLQRDVAKIKEKNESIKDETNKLNSFFSSLLGEDENGKLLTLDQYVDRSVKKLRDQITNLETLQLQNESKFARSEFIIKKLIGNGDDFHFPLYQKVEKIHFENKPKLPVLKDPVSLLDYLEYLMLFAPTVQKVVSSFYHQICAVSNSVYDREEKEVSIENLEGKIELLNQMELDINELKTYTIDPNKLQLFCEMVEELKKEKAISDQIDDINKQLIQMQNEYVQRGELTDVISDVNQNINNAINDAITELKENDPFFNQSLSGFDSYRSKTEDSSHPAIAAVTPRGTVSHKMMYKQAPSTTRVIIPKKDEIEEVGRYPKRTQKTASRVNIQLDSFPQASSSRSALAVKKKIDGF